MRLFITPYFALIMALTSSAQGVISGQVSDEEGEPLPGANVYLKDTYDGATSDSNGHFEFDTYEEGNQVLMISFVGFVIEERAFEVGEETDFRVKLRLEFNTMDAVTISAGVFEASDEKKVVVLQSLDIATTAGATADIVGALNTLPGTQKVGESGRLFVRGGESRETKIFIDGMETAGFYGTTGPNIPTRSRFSPFLFKGTFFSSGGYSAEYGQALSSVLILNSNDPEPMSEVNLSLMTVGASASLTQAWEDQSIFAELGYYNLGPYQRLVPQNVDWTENPESWSGTLAYKKKFSNGARVKGMGMISKENTGLKQETSLNELGYHEITTDNRYYFGNMVSEFPLKNRDLIYLGVSATRNRQVIGYNQYATDQPTKDYHFKVRYNHQFSVKTILNAGSELLDRRYEETVSDSAFQRAFTYGSQTIAGFAEIDQYLSKQLMFRAGMRTEYSNYTEEMKVSPRWSMAYRIDEVSQVSMAGGLFTQLPDAEFLRLSNRIGQESAWHYILNYQRIKDNKVFRIEGYYKDYTKLITYSDPFDPATFTNSGFGSAYGMELFWRDRGGFENIDYWVTYSWMKSERLYRDYPVVAAPGFTSEHNFSLVVKRFFPALKSQTGATYSFTSGRPYDNPNLVAYNESLTPVYHDLSFNIAYLPTRSVIIYLSATNILGLKQVFGYQYATQPDDNGVYRREAIRLPATRFVFLGCFITLGTNRNQLENL